MIRPFEKDFSSGIVYENSILETLREGTVKKIMDNISNNNFEQAISEAEDYLNTIQNDLTIKNLLLETKIKKELILFEELYNRNKPVNIIKRYSRLDKITSQNEKILSYYQSSKEHVAQKKTAINFWFLFIPALPTYLLVVLGYDEINIVLYYAINIGLFRIIVHLYCNRVNPSILSFIIIAILCLIIAICGFIFFIFLLRK